MSSKSTKKKPVKKGYYKEGGQWVYYANGKKLKGLDILTYHITNQTEKSIPAAVIDSLANAGQDLLLLPQGSKYTSGGKPVSALDAKYAKERGIKLDPLQTEVFPTEDRLGLENSTEYSLDLDANDAFNPFETNSEERPNFGFERIDESLLSPSNTTEAQLGENLKKNQVKYNKPNDDEPGDDTSSTAAVESNDEVKNKEQLKSTAIPKPWARKWAGGDGRSLSDVNAETESALEARGFNLDKLRLKRGYSKNQLLADVRTGRATLDKDRLIANGQVLKIGG